MPSHVSASPPVATVRDRNRVRIETVLRAVAFGALVAAVLRSAGVWSNSTANAGSAVLLRTGGAATNGAGQFFSVVRQSLLAPSPEGTPRKLHLVATAVPSDTARALLTAAGTAGVPVSWTDSIASGAVAIEARALIDPRGGFRLQVAAPTGAAVALGDSLGLIDSVQASGGGGTVDVGRVVGSITAATSSVQAWAPAPAVPVVRRVLLLAQPGWEAKFTLAALEERGWKTDARFSLGRDVTVTQGAPATPDTARYAAVVALDSSALPHVAAIRRYVLTGGGLVLAGAAATLGEFGALLPGRAGARQAGVPGGLQTATPRLGLAWRPIAPDSTALVVERSLRAAGARGGNGAATVVAHRFGAGRVVQVGYDEVWEWRMTGPEGSVEAHRQWWAGLVSSVAFAPELPVAATVSERDAPGAAAPYADTRDRLGGAVGVPSVTAGVDAGSRWELVLAGIAVSALLLEWASRRLRGAR